MNPKLLLVFLLTGIFNFQSIQAQELQRDSSMAVIYFYREISVGFLINFDLYHEDNAIGRVTPGSVLKYECAAGIQEFWGQTESRRSIFIDVKAGRTYYVRCRIAAGAAIGVPTFRQVSAEDAIPHISQILQEKNMAEEVVTLNRLRTFSAAQCDRDTTRALNNLYERKRKGGKTRGSIFLGLGTVSLISALANDEPESLGGVLIFGSIAATGFVQSARYNAGDLQKLLIDYQGQTPLPAKIKRKLKRKDFRW